MTRLFALSEMTESTMMPSLLPYTPMPALLTAVWGTIGVSTDLHVHSERDAYCPHAYQMFSRPHCCRAVTRVAMTGLTWVVSDGAVLHLEADRVRELHPVAMVALHSAPWRGKQDRLGWSSARQMVDFEPAKSVLDLVCINTNTPTVHPPSSSYTKQPLSHAWSQHPAHPMHRTPHIHIRLHHPHINTHPHVNTQPALSSHNTPCTEYAEVPVPLGLGSDPNACAA